MGNQISCGSFGASVQAGTIHGGVHAPTPTPDRHRPDSRQSPYTLPRDVAAFTGREDQLHRLLTATANGPAQVVVIHTVDGLPGVGKTALVTHAARQLARHYPDGPVTPSLKQDVQHVRSNADGRIPG
ncbi:ATP-binding protein [Streptomyces malaysiensis subsp. malaysiensis]|uniref:ATP-binding protein n=1 Tax=Streptomyces TaxID=1883 RepID=UPI001E2F5539|nr:MULTISPECIES: ATP-binding protein [unclassified Streptomyces]MCD9593866.1 ATP-binding protein [Streptomyces sp. 8ZJF_21]MCQ6251242.1 ATP-binding protein [Streptomyces malaysiensis]WHX23933.1 ATP-binding protein [Streptomyces sp. NA07423]